MSSARVATLVEFTVLAAGVQMGCHYCGADTRIGAFDVTAQILMFQEAHFGCDPDAAGPR